MSPIFLNSDRGDATWFGKPKFYISAIAFLKSPAVGADELAAELSTRRASIPEIRLVSFPQPPARSVHLLATLPPALSERMTRTRRVMGKDEVVCFTPVGK